MTSVTSQRKALSPFQGIKVMPSGLLPSDRDNPFGSLQGGILARFMAKIIYPMMTSHSTGNLFARKTSIPHGHLWGSQRFTPRFIPTATLTASSSKRNPQEVIGRACSQSPLCGTDTTLNRALLYSSLAWL